MVKRSDYLHEAAGKGKHLHKGEKEKQQKHLRTATLTILPLKGLGKFQGNIFGGEKPCKRTAYSLELYEKCVPSKLFFLKFSEITGLSAHRTTLISFLKNYLV